MKITRAGQIEGTGKRISVSVPATEEQVALGYGETLEFEIPPITGRMQLTVLEAVPDAVPPEAPGQDGKPEFNFKDAHYLQRRMLVTQKQRIALAVLLLGPDYFGTTNVEEHTAVLLGPAERGGLTLGQINLLVAAAERESGLTSERREAVDAELRPTGSTGAEAVAVAAGESAG